jgi:hypothetical protein
MKNRITVRADGRTTENGVRTLIKNKTVAVTAASLLASVGLAASFAPAAHAATPASTRTVEQLKKVPGGLTFTAAGKQRMAAVHGASTSTLGAVTFVDNYQYGSTTAPTVTETLSQDGTNVGTLSDLEGGDITEPQLLPAGTYTLTATTDETTPTTLATETLTVTAGSDSSAVLYLGGGGDTPATLSSFADPITATPTGQAVISVRHTSANAGPVDVYVNGVKEVSNANEGAVANLTVAPGSYDVVITTAVADATAPTAADTLAEATATVTADTFSPVYAIDDSTPGATSPVNVDSTTYTLGYQFTASDGGVFTYGGYPFEGSSGSLKLNKPVVGGAESPYGDGYYLAASDGGVFAYGDNAPFEGSAGSLKLNSPIVGIASTIGLDGNPGYWLVAADGGIFSYNEPFYGSLGGKALTSPVVGIATDNADGGYVIAEADGSVTAFGPDITTPTTTASISGLNKPIVGVATTPDGAGLWLVASDGGVFNAGDAQFLGSTGSLKLNQPIVGISPTFDGQGYSLIAADGGIFNYGNSTFFGSTGNLKLNKPIVSGIN